MGGARHGAEHYDGVIRLSACISTVRASLAYTAVDVRALKAHSKARTPVAKVSRLMKRTEGALRQKAKMLGIGLGHWR